MGWGDEMMASGEVNAIYEGKPIAILRAQGESPRTSIAWENNPQIAKPGQRFDRFVINGPGHRPYVENFQYERWTWKPYKPKPGRIFFSENEDKFSQECIKKLGKNFVALEPHCKDKQEAVNRDWGWSKWVKLAELLDKQGIDLAQFGPIGTTVLPKAKFLQTSSPRMMAAALQHAKAFVSTEGGFHHTAAALNIPGVVIFGHFISPKVTGYDIHTNIWSGQIGCGLRVPCSSCRSYLDSLDPEEVAKDLMKILS